MWWGGCVYGGVTQQPDSRAWCMGGVTQQPDLKRESFNNMTEKVETLSSFPPDF